MTNLSPTRPILRWHGGKWMLAPWILSHFPAHRVYIEPYGGAASVLLRKRRSYLEVYNDLDSDVVNLFRVLRDPKGAAKLVEAIDMTPFSREEFDGAYKPTRNRVERARRLIVRSFQGFGSNGHARKTGFRFATRETSTSPASDWTNYPESLAAVVERLRGVVIESRPALEVIGHYNFPDVLVYVDPPYLPETRDAGRDYSHEMSVDDHERLAQTLRATEAMVVLSGYRSPLYDGLYDGWKRVGKTTYADAGRHGKSSRTECLWLNPAAVAGQSQKSLEVAA